MTTTQNPGPAGTRASDNTRLAVLAITALVSLVLSPITAVWVLIVGPLLLLAGWLAPRARGVGALLTYGGAGLLLGVLPYFALAVVVS